MEQNNNSGQSFQDAASSNIILGTSSEAIIEGLHSGSFAEEAAIGDTGTDDDKDQIVNQQGQNEIVNPVEKDYDSKNTLPTDINPQQVSSNDTLYSDKTDKELSDDEMIPEEESDRLPGV